MIGIAEGSLIGLGILIVLLLFFGVSKLSEE